MKTSIAKSLFLAAFSLSLGTAAPQTQQEYVLSRSVTAIGYKVGGGGTKVDMQGTSLLPQANGEAKVEAKKGITNIQVQMQGLAKPTTLGTEFLTYVLWVVSPDGRSSNVGEIQIDNSGQGKLNATSQSSTFSLFITAEPYFSVRLPSEMVVAANQLRKDTKGKIFPVSEYKLMRRTQYQKMGNPLALGLDLKNVPLEMYEARNAVDIAQSRGAPKYAPEIFSKAQGSLQIAENALAQKANKKDIISTARQTVQFAEDARALAVQRQDAERIENERLAAAAAAKANAEAKAAAEAAEAQRAADLEARRQAQIAAEREAQMKAQAQQQAELAAAREAALKAESEATALKAKMEADALKAKEEAAKADAERARQAAQALRTQLLDQFNRILETRDTPRGLVVNMSDVLFDIGKYDLKGPTREKLARLSGIMLGHPGLNLSVEGYTDNTGSDELNQKLSEQRAATVRDYLIAQGLPLNNVTSQGFGKANPVADNSTSAGRQQNRRVEIVVSGEIIGVKLGAAN